MHAMAGELDMRKMSGLKAVLPKTRWLMLIGCLALAGFPFLSGFYSKDDIVGAALHRSLPLGILLLITAFMTAYYTFRLYFRVFEGPLVVPEAPAPAHDHGHDSHDHAAHDDGHGHGAHDHGHYDHEPSLMIVPLYVLAFGAIVAGYFNFPERVHSLGGFLAQSPSFVLGQDVASRAAGASVQAARFGLEKAGEAHESPVPGLLLGGAIAIAGILLAGLLHLINRGLADRIAQAFPSLASLIENKFYVDEFYQEYIIEPLRFLGEIFFAIDRFIVDGLVNLMGWIPQLSGFTLKLTVQRGYLQGYATTMLFGVMIILLLVFLN